MKVGFIYNLLEENVSQIITRPLMISKGPEGNFFEFSNVDILTTAIKNIATVLDSFESITRLKQHYPQFYNGENTFYCKEKTTSDNISRLIQAIHDEVYSSMKLLEKLLPLDDGYIINVKLPDYNNLTELTKFYKDLEFTLNPIVKFSGGTNLEIYSFENGSKWNDFLVRNAVVFGLVLQFLSTGSQLCSDILDIRQSYSIFQQVPNTSAITSEQIKNIDGIFETLIDQKFEEYAESYIEFIKETNTSINSHGKTEAEIKTTVIHSYKTYVQLIEEGTEFYGEIKNDTMELDDKETLESISASIQKLELSQKKVIEYKETKRITNSTLKSLDTSSHTENNDN